MKRKVKVTLWMALMCVLLFALPASAAGKISKKKATLVVGQTLKLKMKKVRGKVKWSSTKKAVASVNKKGLVTAKKPGKATIKAKVAGKTYKCKVTVKENVFTGTNYDIYAQPKIENVTVLTKVIKMKFTSADSLDITLAMQPIGGGIIVRRVYLTLFDQSGKSFFDQWVVLKNATTIDDDHYHELTINMKKKDFNTFRFIDLTKLKEDSFKYSIGY